MKATSRLSRWQGSAAPDTSGETDRPRHRTGLEEQALEAMEAAMVASRSASDRLDRRRRAIHTRTGQACAVGAAGLAGLLGIAVLPADGGAFAIGIAGACAAAVAIAGAALAHAAWTGDKVVESAAAAIAGDLVLGADAKMLAQLAALLADEPVTTAETLLARLVAGAGRAAAAARERESAIRGGAAVQGRRHERIVPRQTRVTVTTLDGRSLIAQIADISQSGVALEGNFPGLGVGHRLTVGSRPAKVVRVQPRGLACEFARLIPAATLTPDIVL